MGLFDFLKKRNKKYVVTDDIDKSQEQILFADMVVQIFTPSLENLGFVLHSKQVKKYSSNIIYSKGGQYVKITGTTYPTDYPYFFNVLLENHPENNHPKSDWYSVPLWAMAKVIDTQHNAVECNFPFNEQVIPTIEQAEKDLLKYGNTFLNGDISLLVDAAKLMDEINEPYRIEASKDAIEITFKQAIDLFKK